MTPIPAILITDTREQTPWTFGSCSSPTVCFHVCRRALPAGDYAAHLVGEDAPAETAVVERKTHADLVATLTTGRARFERELPKLQAYGFAALVIEADLPAIAEGVPFSRANPLSIVASLVAFSQRFNVHVVFASNRRFAEAYAYRILERWVRDRAEARHELAEAEVSDAE